MENWRIIDATEVSSKKHTFIRKVAIAIIIFALLSLVWIPTYLVAVHASNWKDPITFEMLKQNVETGKAKKASIMASFQTPVSIKLVEALEEDNGLPEMSEEDFMKLYDYYIAHHELVKDKYDLQNYISDANSLLSK